MKITIEFMFDPDEFDEAQKCANQYGVEVYANGNCTVEMEDGTPGNALGVNVPLEKFELPQKEWDWIPRLYDVSPEVARQFSAVWRELDGNLNALRATFVLMTTMLEGESKPLFVER